MCLLLGSCEHSNPQQFLIVIECQEDGLAILVGALFADIAKVDT